MLRYFSIAVLACLSVTASVFAAPVPVPGDAPVAVDRLRPGNPAVLPMTGIWRFKLDKGESHIPAKPRSTANATFPATAGMDTLRLEFIHPDGRSVYAVSLKVKG